MAQFSLYVHNGGLEHHLLHFYKLHKYSFLPPNKHDKFKQCKFNVDSQTVMLAQQEISIRLTYRVCWKQDYIISFLCFRWSRALE